MITELHAGIFNIIRVGDSLVSRIPAIYLKDMSSALEVRLAQTADLADTGNLSFKSNPIPLNTWTHVWLFVQQEEDGGYAFYVVIDNVTALRELIPDPTTYSNIFIYASDDLQTAAHARIRNIVHETSPKKGMSHTNQLCF